MSYWSKAKTVICKKPGNGITINMEYTVLQYDDRDKSIHISCDDGGIRMTTDIDVFFYNETEIRNMIIERILND